MKTQIKYPVSRKFMLAVLATTFSALLVSAIAMLAYDTHNFKNVWVSDLKTQSDILAQISLAPLEFNDSKVAEENLGQLRARPTIISGAIYAPNGTLFAVYSSTREGASEFPRRPQAAGYVITGNKITYFRPILRDGKLAGTIFLRAQYPLDERIRNFFSIMAATMGGSLLIAALVSIWLQSAVTKPIRALTEAVHHVIRNRDFSKRVEKTTQDEIGVLVDSFNSMLTEIGQRAEALSQLNSTLEERIVARTLELEKTHEQLRQSQKLEAVGQLTGGVAHDFNNVLQVIVGNLQLLHMDAADDQVLRKRLETASFAAERGAKLSAQLLAFARRQPLRPVVANLARILRGMDDLLRRTLGESIHIETVVAGGLWNTLIDTNQLENAILNLAINARDAMSGHGKLTLELGNALLDDHYTKNEQDVPAGQYIMLAVSDTGAGMSPEVLARVFEPFFTTKREGQGTGLGLSMVYGFVKQSNGHIRIYSEVGSGTTVKIYLPRSFQPEAETNETLAGPVIGGAETILVVEDDLVVQATAVDMLTGLGYRVLKANDGQSALNVLHSGIPIDLLFTDVVMPGPVRSPDLAKQAKQIFPNIEVLFTSGYTQNAIVHGGRLDPGVALLSKPYRREDLARKVRYMLSNRQPTQTNIRPQHSDTGEVEQFGKTASALHILVVEDNEDANKILCEFLSMLGHQPEGALSAESALEIFERSQAEVLLTDVNLPGMSGIQLAELLKKNWPDLKVIFSSGYGDVSLNELPFEAVSLVKPYDLDKLQAALSTFNG